MTAWWDSSKFRIINLLTIEDYLKDIIQDRNFTPLVDLVMQYGISNNGYLEFFVAVAVLIIFLVTLFSLVSIQFLSPGQLQFNQLIQ